MYGKIKSMVNLYERYEKLHEPHENFVLAGDEIQ
jgi:hypothetical protein